jgi:predicted RNase H-like nuclease (RuvC/YqgF family)
MAQETPSQTFKDKLSMLKCLLKAAINESDHYEAECEKLRSELTEVRRERDILREKMDRVRRLWRYDMCPIAVCIDTADIEEERAADGDYVRWDDIEAILVED